MRWCSARKLGEVTAITGTYREGVETTGGFDTDRAPEK